MLLQTRFLHVLIASGVALALATPAVAGNVYSWMTEDGTYAYADSLKGVPKAYRAKAKTSQMGKLKHYARYTPSDRAAKGSYNDRLAGNLDRLRGNSASTAAARSATQVPTIQILTDSKGGGIDVPLTGQGALEIEKVRTRLKGDMSTRHYTIVRQGGEVIAVYKGADNSRRIVEVDPREILEYRASDL
jgi:hypothetical protein